MGSLNKVQGVGAKLSLNILSLATTDSLLEAISLDDFEFFCKFPGVGKKVGKRITVELSSDIEKLYQYSKMEKNNLPKKNKEVDLRNKKIINDAVSALANLGHERRKAFNVLVKITNEKK